MLRMNHPHVSPWALASLLLMLFLAAIDTTILSTAMPRIVGLLGGAELYHWAFTAFMLSSTLALPFFGRLADQVGIRRCMLGAGAVFIAGSALCMLAPDMLSLILGRALQGLGAAGLQGLPMIAFGVLFPPEQRGARQSLISMVWGFSSLAGPASGGLIVSYLSWRWIFALNVGLGLVALLIFWLSYPKQEVQLGSQKLDLIGSLLLTAALTSLLLLSTLSLAGSQYLLWLGVAALLGAFVWRQGHTGSPLIPLHPFANQTYAAACLLGFVSNFVGFAALTYVPFYLQELLHQSPEASGLVMTPMMLAWPIASAAGGFALNRMGFRKLSLLGCALLALSMGAWTTIAAGYALPGLVLWCMCLGAGMGLVTPPLLIAVQTVVARHEIGVASSTLVLLRQIGATLGISLMGTLQVQTLAGVGLQSSLMLVFACLAGFAVLALIAAIAMPPYSPAQVATSTHQQA
ncbi:MAG: MFS transporter [Candidatus Melainabacteria bacterium HGW-Melainabacteria-1]|nr:MAG: MFS transporter [Candidatus Melainabacteria bacterium HGW-Melainabacteria-1]